MMQFLHTLCQETPLTIDSFAKALWRHHGQRDGSVKEREPDPLVRSALQVYRDLLSQREMLLERATDLS
ncbi:hypothetical protein I305_05891 [Cryptococcus gattii E566]|nr:hypothetical protein I305_05891 [Cryptococcus gattii E566]